MEIIDVAANNLDVTQFAPTRNNLLIKIIKATEGKTAGGLILPAQVSGMKDVVGKAEVIAVGPDVECCSVGDFIICERAEGRALTMDSDCMLMKDTNVMAVIRNGKE